MVPAPRVAPGVYLPSGKYTYIIKNFRQKSYSFCTNQTALFYCIKFRPPGPPLPEILPQPTPPLKTPALSPGTPGHGARALGAAELPFGKGHMYHISHETPRAEARGFFCSKISASLDFALRRQTKRKSRFLAAGFLFIPGFISRVFCEVFIKKPRRIGGVCGNTKDVKQRR